MACLLSTGTNKMRKFVGKWRLFLRWWLLLMLISVGGYLLGLGGLLAAVFTVDFTKICFLIYAIFAIFLIRGGVLSYKLSKKGFITEEEYAEFCDKSELAWFVSEKMLTLGMIGTVLGFIFMLGTSFAGLSTLTIPLLQAALLKMSAGASAALYTTASGLICGLLLQIHLFDFSQYLDRLAESCGHKVKSDETP